MVSITSIKTIPGEVNEIEIDIDNQTIALTKAEITLLATPAAMRGRLEQLFGGPLPNIHIHRNRGNPANGYAVATGKNPPSVWPEDEL